jgi:hypothetical protein
LGTEPFIDADETLKETVLQIVTECTHVPCNSITNDTELGEKSTEIGVEIAAHLHFCFLDLHPHTTVGQLIEQILKPKQLPQFDDFEIRTA